MTRHVRNVAVGLAATVASAAVLVALPVDPAVAETINNGCIQDAAGFNLNCTSNDVAVAGVARDSSDEPLLTIIDDGCAYPGDTVDFTATFDVLLNAQARYDIGIYFATDGGGTDGAMTGRCSVTTLDAANTNQFVQLDGSPDTCGDIDAAHNPLHPTITVTGVLCEDKNSDGFLDFPNCISWRQPGSNGTCTDPTSAFPGAPSKCKCDAGFTVPIQVPAATIEVTKTAGRLSVPEPGGSVTYTVVVKNMGIDPNNPFTLTSLVDDKFGDLDGQGTCSVPQTISQSRTYECSFAATVAGNVSDSPHKNVITASGMDLRGNSASDTDDATVEITGVEPAIWVEKTASETELLEPGGSVTYTVKVRNDSVSSDPIKITYIEDDKFGLLSGKGTCDSSSHPYPDALASGATYTCQFSGSISGNTGYVHTNTVKAHAVDDDGKTTSASDDATVTITNSPSSISVTKTASPTALAEPGGTVTYSVVVKNLSAVDAVTITSLSDDKFGSLNGLGTCGVPQNIAQGGQYACSFTKALAGEAGDSHVNTITASGVDDDGTPVTGSDGATVNFNDVLPAATLTKSVTQALVTYQVSVTNDKSVEEVYLNSLVDDQFGDVMDSDNAALVSTDCAPATLAPKGQSGDSYTCWFSAVVTTSPHVNTVTASVEDNDTNVVTPAPSDSASVTFTN